MTGTDPYLPGHGDARYAVDRYELDLDYGVGGNHLEATAVLRLHCLEPLDDIELDLYRLRVGDVRVDGADLSRWTHRRSKLRLRFAGVVDEGAVLTVRVRYRGNPRPMPGPDGRAGWEELSDGVLVAAQPHGAPSWFPCNDRMDDKARYRIQVTTDPAYHVAANGTLVRRTPSGRSLAWVYEHDQPMAPYLVTCQIGRYVVEQQHCDAGVAVELVAPPSLLATVRASTADQPRMIALFADLFGPYPFEGYRVVVTDDPLEIPLESQTLSTFGRNHMSRDWEAQRLIAHELAHQWFGNAVTAGRLADIWLHEGFACYAEWLWSEASGRESTDAQARHHHELLRSEAQDLVLVDPGKDRTFDDRVYKRGALALHALRRRFGDDAFFALLREWFDAQRYGTVSTADFEAVVDRVGGEPALDLLRAWLRVPELPPLDLPAVPTGGQGNSGGP